MKKNTLNKKFHMKNTKLLKMKKEMVVLFMLSIASFTPRRLNSMIVSQSKVVEVEFISAIKLKVSQVSSILIASSLIHALLNLVAVCTFSAQMKRVQ